MSAQAIRRIRAVLTPELRKRAWQDAVHPMAGHCYHAAEALWYVLGGKRSGFVPVVSVVTPDERHWFLRHRETGIVLDPTEDQYPPRQRAQLHRQGRGCGFLTRHPSKRALEVLVRMAQEAA